VAGRKCKNPKVSERIPFRGAATGAAIGYAGVHGGGSPVMEQIATSR